MLYDAFGRIAEFSIGGPWLENWLTQLPGAAVNMVGTTINAAYFPAPGGHGTVFVYGNGSHPYYRHNDWLGSARITSNVADNTAHADIAFTPYGEQMQTLGGSSSAYFNFAGLSADFNNGIQYESQNRELGIYGFWFSPDPAGQGWNQYAYATNPNSFVDPSGLYVDGPHQCSISGDPCNGGGGAGGIPTDPGGDNNGYYFMGLPISSSTFDLFMTLGQGVTSVSINGGSTGGGLMIGSMGFVPWGYTKDGLWAGTSFLGGGITQWGDWVDFGGTSIPGSVTTTIPGGGWISGGDMARGFAGASATPVQTPTEATDCVAEMTAAANQAPSPVPDTRALISGIITGVATYLLPPQYGGGDGAAAAVGFALGTGITAVQNYGEVGLRAQAALMGCYASQGPLLVPVGN